jgi:SAM-dependent methyltransferase
MSSGCRFCSAPLDVVFADLGMSPIANAYLPAGRDNEMEPFYPLRALVCERCLLVQLEEFETPEQIFGDYAYFSSYSSTWLEHARLYAAAMVERFGLDESSKVVEVASNDGYLLRFFHERGIPVLGVEPAANVARVAQDRGIPTQVEFFGEATAAAIANEGKADLLLGNNVLAHVPDLNDFVKGMKLLLADGGQITMEFPHLVQLVEKNQWDTIYHEHFSYFSFTTVTKVFEAHGLRLFDVDELSTHGGSLRIYGCHQDDPRPTEQRATDLLAREERDGYTSIELYANYDRAVTAEKRQILKFLIDLKREGNTIVGYGAPAKGNTLLNYCGVGTDFLDYTCDLSPHKQGQLLPGTHIPIRSPDALREDKPDVVLILPWNLKDEIMEQVSFIREWTGRFAARAPELQLFE